MPRSGNGCEHATRNLPGIAGDDVIWAVRKLSQRGHIHDDGGSGDAGHRLPLWPLHRAGPTVIRAVGARLNGIRCTLGCAMACGGRGWGGMGRWQGELADLGIFDCVRGLDRWDGDWAASRQAVFWLGTAIRGASIICCSAACALEPT